MIHQLFEFINKSATSFHTIAELKEILKSHGYTELFEGSKFKLEKGGRYFVTRNMSSLIAFCVPENDFDGFLITASHSDSPAFKLKPNPQLNGGYYTTLNTEKYGGVNLSSWLDRPLGIAGRLMVKKGDTIETVLVDTKGPVCVIPSVAGHLGTPNSDQLKPQTDMLPLFTDNTGDLSVTDLFSFEGEVLGSDLFVYNCDKGVLTGGKKEYALCPRLDDLASVFGTLKGFLNCKNPSSMPLFCVFDNEEVGSQTKQGAASTFLTDTLHRVMTALDISKEAFLRKLTSSFMVSADNGHGVHPNHPEKSDPQCRPVLNGGILIKYSANQKYTTDGVSEAIFKSILKRAEIPYQEYVNNSNILGGSTLGNILSASLSVNSIDIGLPQLAMHSACETMGVKDIDYLIAAIEKFYNSTIKATQDGTFITTL